MHQDLHREARGPGQGVLRPRGHRPEVTAAGRGHRRGDEPQGGPRNTRPGLYRHQRLNKGGQAHTELHQRRQQDGLEKILRYERIVSDDVCRNKECTDKGYLYRFNAKISG